MDVDGNATRRARTGRRADLTAHDNAPLSSSDCPKGGITGSAVRDGDYESRRPAGGCANVDVHRVKTPGTGAVVALNVDRQVADGFELIEQQTKHLARGGPSTLSQSDGKPPNRQPRARVLATPI